MKTVIKYIDNITGNRSDCGNPLEIETSSRDLNWHGILIEKGWAQHFNPDNIITPYYYFAMATNEHCNWQAKNGEKTEIITTQRGDIWINPPNTPFTHSVDEPCYFIIFTVEEKILYDNFDGIIPDEKLQFLNSYNIQDENLGNMIELFYNEAKSGGINGSHYIMGLVRAFSNYFIRNYSDYNEKINNQPEFKIAGKKLDIIEKYISENIGNEISIESLAKLLKMSKFYFLKEFKKAKGITPYQYILQTKLERSRNLLENTAKNIAEISYDLGFSDQSHFTNLFKKYFGISPKKFKSNILQKAKQ
jgi:AraC family transcriptional regulator